MNHLEGKIKLYEIPQMSKIFCETNDGSTYIMFHHLDGMFSYCETEKGNPCHVGASQPLKKVKGGYKLV